MKTVALISGGKDSCYHMLQCLAEGHEIVALAHLMPIASEKNDNCTERDSYMYQSVASEGVSRLAEAIDLPYFSRKIQGHAINQKRDYTETLFDEVEDLAALLAEVCKSIPHVQAVASGAILSDYQRLRVEHVAHRLGLTSLSYLWRRDQSQLLKEMVACEVDAVVVKVASMGLTPSKHLGKPIRELVDELEQLGHDCQLNVCGEGGEFESFTLDSPQFKQRLVIEKSSVIRHSEDEVYAPVAYLHLEEISLLPKPQSDVLAGEEAARELPMMTSEHLDQLLRGDDWQEIVDEITGNKFAEVSEDTAIPKSNGDVNDDDCSWSMFMISDIEGHSENGGSSNDYHLTKDTLGRLRTELHKHDCTPEDVLYVWLLLADMDSFVSVNRAYSEIFPAQSPPARACIQVRLPPGIRLRVACLLPKSTREKQVLHVRSLSHWAPANIGPYSQAVSHGCWTLVAGQIGLRPSDLSIPDPLQVNMEAEALLAARHVHRVLHAANCPGGWSQVAVVIGYCSSSESMLIGRRVLHTVLCSEYCSCESSTLLVHVPGLPKHARIEWQCVSARQKVSDRVHVRRLVWSGDPVKVLQQLTDMLRESSTTKICFFQNDRLKLGQGLGAGLLKIPVEEFEDRALCAVLVLFL